MNYKHLITFERARIETLNNLGYSRRYIFKSKPKGKYSSEIGDEIQDLLLKTWSPEQIANTSMNNKVSYKTIYNWIYSGFISKSDLSVLRQKGKRRKSAKKRGKFLIGKSISERPKEVKKRECFGHFLLIHILHGNEVVMKILMA